MSEKELWVVSIPVDVEMIVYSTKEEAAKIAKQNFHEHMLDDPLRLDDFDITNLISESSISRSLEPILPGGWDRTCYPYTAYNDTPNGNIGMIIDRLIAQDKENAIPDPAVPLFPPESGTVTKDG